jgi:predicted DNA-binding transcriptional regulator AlpA
MKNKTTHGEMPNDPTVKTPTEPDDELWDAPKVQEYFGGSKPIHISTLYRGVNSGLYPRPMNVSPNVVRWIPRECRAARKRMLDERGDPKPPPPPARRGRPRGRKAAKSAAATTAEPTT